MANVPKVGVKVESAHGDSLWALCWTLNNHLLTASIDGTVHLWKIEATDVKCVAKTSKQKYGVTSITATKAGNIAVVGYEDSTIRTFALPSLTLLSTIEAGMMEAWTVCLSPMDDVIVSGTHKGSLNIWSMQDGHEKLTTLETQNKFVLNSTFNKDGRKLACSGIDGFVNIFDIETKKIINKIEAHAMAARSITYSPDGNLIYTASDDKHVCIFDTVSGSVVNSFSQSGMAYSVDASNDHRHFIVGCADSKSSYWDLGMQRCLHTYDVHKDQVWGVAFDKSSSQSRTFASVGDDGILQLYS